ncbi:hypothetical protein EDD85DRAFT_947517 [Armillaria nabsnona]|nr:hypothetical protein EDD85DRAFT_947517 [Armillaria nabsnona]
MQNVHIRRRRQRTNPEPDNRPGGHSRAASPFSPAHLQTSLARSWTIVGRHQIQQATQGRQRLLSTVAQTVETQIEGLSNDGRGLSRILPSRLTADQGQLEGQFPQAWQKLEEYSELNIVSLAGGVASLAATAFRGSTVVPQCLLYSVLSFARSTIASGKMWSHLARLTVKVKKLLSSFSKILDITGPEIVQVSQIILDGLAEAMASVINEGDKLSAAISTEEWYEQFLRAFAPDTVRSTIANAEKAVDDAEDQFNRMLLLYVVLHVKGTSRRTTEG